MNTHPQTIHRLLDMVMPDTCVLCKRIVKTHQPHLLCEHCLAALPFNDNFCRACALPLSNADQTLCGKCQMTPLTEDKIAVPLRYEGAARYMLKRFKFNSGWREGSSLSHLLSQHLRAHHQTYAGPKLIVPVPISRRTRWQRGFNQAHYIAAQLGRQLELPVSSLGIRKRHTPAQRTLSQTERHALRRSAFHLSKPITTGHIALVDDVLTTGSTTRVLRNLLLDQGVEQVDIWCLCRAVIA